MTSSLGEKVNVLAQQDLVIVLQAERFCQENTLHQRREKKALSVEQLQVVEEKVYLNGWKLELKVNI